MVWSKKEMKELAARVTPNTIAKARINKIKIMFREKNPFLSIVLIQIIRL
jgi:hypothetical protein